MPEEPPEPRSVRRRTGPPDGERPSRSWLTRGGSLVYPGLGQLLAGRWGPGLIYMGIATLGVVLIAAPVIELLATYVAAYRDAWSGGELNGEVSIGWGRMGLGFVLVFIAYVVSLLDPCMGRNAQPQLPDEPESKE